MAIKLYNYSLSGSCYKVRLLLDFLEVKYDCEQIDFYPGKEHKGLDFLDINPLGQLPALEDDGIVLRDAQAILCHIANKFDTSDQWLPRDPQLFGSVMMWLMFAGGELMAASAARLHDMLQYDLDIDVARQNAKAAFQILEDHMVIREIEGHQWIVGSSPTIADIACFPYIALSADGGIGHENYPALRNWMRNFRKLPRFDAISGVQEFA